MNLEGLRVHLRPLEIALTYCITCTSAFTSTSLPLHSIVTTFHMFGTLLDAVFFYFEDCKNPLDLSKMPSLLRCFAQRHPLLGLATFKGTLMDFPAGGMLGKRFLKRPSEQHPQSTLPEVSLFGVGSPTKRFGSEDRKKTSRRPLWMTSLFRAVGGNFGVRKT